jgi:hypothetical protein
MYMIYSYVIWKCVLLFRKKKKVCSVVNWFQVVRFPSLDAEDPADVQNCPRAGGP